MFNSTLYHRLCLFVVLFIPAIALADWVSEYQTLALKQNLENHRYWRLLLKVDDNNYSMIRDKNYFISPSKNRKIDLQKELLNSIKALLSTKNLNSKQHFQCQFPLRSQWLIEQLNIPQTAIKEANCYELNHFLRQYSQANISLVFIDEQVKFIPNMMGHIALRIQSPTSDKIISYYTLLHSLNPATMLYKALIDGGNGELKIEDYKKIKNHYLKQEQRSTWNFPLSLNEQETHTLLKHLWEFKNRDGVYSYLSYNCGTAIIELLQIANPEIDKIIQTSLNNRYKYWYSPLEYIQLLDEKLILAQPSLELTQRDSLQKPVKNVLRKSPSSRLAFSLKEPQNLGFYFAINSQKNADDQRFDYDESELEIMAIEGDIDEKHNLNIKELILYQMYDYSSVNQQQFRLNWHLYTGGLKLPTSNTFFSGLSVGIGVSYQDQFSANPVLIRFLLKSGYYYGDYEQGSNHQPFIEPSMAINSYFNIDQYDFKLNSLWQNKLFFNNNKLNYQQLENSLSYLWDNNNNINLGLTWIEAKNRILPQQTIASIEWVRFF